VASTELGKLYQDVTGALGSLIGIKRRPKLDRKPSDLLIEHMGQGQKNRLFDLNYYGPIFLLPNKGTKFFRKSLIFNAARTKFEHRLPKLDRKIFQEN
jgi:hypothetical protein